MRSRKYQSTLGSLDSHQESDVRKEIDHFLLALRSYPESFAHNPRLSFQKHLFRIMASQVLPGDEQHTH